MYRHGSWRWLSFAVLAAFVTAGCGKGPVGEAPASNTAAPPGTTTSPSVIAEPAAPPDPPGSWITVNETGNGFAVRQWTDGVSKSIGAWQAQPAGGSLAATDLTLSDAGRIGLVGTCCEPVAGTIFAADGSGGDLASVDQGYRVDARVRGDLVVRADTAGNLAMTRQPEPPYFIESAGAIDVTVMPDGRVVALVNPRHISNPDPGPNAPALIVLTSDGGAWTQQRVELEHEYCAVVGLANGRVGLIRTPPRWSQANPCSGAKMDLHDLRGGTTGTVDLLAEAIHVTSDDSGTYVLVAGATGTLSWLTLDGRRGDLPSDASLLLAAW